MARSVSLVQSESGVGVTGTATRSGNVRCKERGGAEPGSLPGGNGRGSRLGRAIGGHGQISGGGANLEV